MAQREAPIPKPRTKVIPLATAERQDLLRAFEGFNSNAVDDKQIELARACIAAPGKHYQLIDFNRIVELNKVSVQNHDVCVQSGMLVCIWGYHLSMHISHFYVATWQCQWWEGGRGNHWVCILIIST